MSVSERDDQKNPVDEAIELANEDDIWGEGPAQEDPTADLIKKAIDLVDEDEEDDDGGFDAPIKETKKDQREQVSESEGLDLIDQAKRPGPPDAEAQKDAPKAGEDDAGETKAKAEDKPEEAASDKPEESTEDSGLSQLGIEDLLDGVDESKAGEISKRLEAAAALNQIFKPHTAELERHGTTPEAAMKRLVDLNAFAQQKPDEYLAWVAGEVGGSEPQKILEAAAKRFGYELVQVDDDLFDDEGEEKAANPSEFGPDAPHNRVMRELQEFTTETDANGQLKRPLWQYVQNDVSEMCKRHAEESGKGVTVQDLDRFYQEAADKLRSSIAPGEQGKTPSAAQPGQAVADREKQAAAAAKAKRASKSTGGTGQGASRRSAPPADASVYDTVSFFTDRLGD